MRIVRIQTRVVMFNHIRIVGRPNFAITAPESVIPARTSTVTESPASPPTSRRADTSAANMHATMQIAQRTLRAGRQAVRIAATDGPSEFGRRYSRFLSAPTAQAESAKRHRSYPRARRSPQRAAEPRAGQPRKSSRHDPAGGRAHAATTAPQASNRRRSRQALPQHRYRDAPAAHAPRRWC